MSFESISNEIDEINVKIKLLQVELIRKKSELKQIKENKKKEEEEEEEDNKSILIENILMDFLKSDQIVFGTDTYCREKIFVEKFENYCKQNKITKKWKWTSLLYSEAFVNLGIKLSKNQRRRYPNRSGEPSYSGTFIIGVDVKS